MSNILVLSSCSYTNFSITDNDKKILHDILISRKTNPEWVELENGEIIKVQDISAIYPSSHFSL